MEKKHNLKITHKISDIHIQTIKLNYIKQKKRFNIVNYNNVNFKQYIRRFIY